MKSYECQSNLLAVVSKMKPQIPLNTLESSLTFKNIQSILSYLFCILGHSLVSICKISASELELERNASLRPPFCVCFEDHELRIIHSLGGEYC